MPLGDFAEAGTTPRPLPIGRTLRFIAGLGTGFYFVWNIIQFSGLVDADIPDAGYFVGVGFAWWYLSDAFVVGFGLRWGRKPQVAALVAAAILVLIDFAAYGEAWDLPLAWGLWVMVEFFYGFIALSFILAAVFAVPG